MNAKLQALAAAWNNEAFGLQGQAIQENKKGNYKLAKILDKKAEALANLAQQLRDLDDNQGSNPSS